MNNLLEVKNLTKYFFIKSGIISKTIYQIKAVDNISFNINENMIFALVGESGSGKTTTAKCILKLYEPTSGEILFEGKNITNLRGKELKWYRSRVQAVFQNPFLSLNPRMHVESIIAEPLKTHTDMSKQEIKERVRELIKNVGLPEGIEKQYPLNLSGGQAQRVAIARALAINPKLIILDEPTSALDVSIQAQILNLLIDLKEKFNLSYMLITHDLSVVRYISDYVAVMYLGRIVEYAQTEELFNNPLHPYTQALISSIPEPDPTLKKLERKVTLTGELISSIKLPTGCKLNPRCPYVMDICKKEEPELISTGKDHLVRCWLYSDKK